jgi:general secretion pathway protein I
MRRAARRRRARGEAGFSLLEVLIAVAILASSIIVILNIVTRNVRATNHAKMTTTATFLARSKIVDVEDEVRETGFVDNDQDDQGDFSEEGFPQFRWRTLVEKVELPTDIAQQAQEGAQDATQSGSPLMAMAGFMGGFMSALIEPIRIGLEESVRRVTVQVTWDEIGRGDQTIEVVTFVTDPSKLDMAMGGLAGAAGLPSGAGAGAGAGAGTGATPGGATPGAGGGTPPTGGAR